MSALRPRTRPGSILLARPRILRSAPYTLTEMAKCQPPRPLDLLERDPQSGMVRGIVAHSHAAARPGPQTHVSGLRLIVL